MMLALDDHSEPLMSAWFFALVYLVPASLPISYSLGQWLGIPDLAAWLPLVFLFGLLPAADFLLGETRANPTDAATEKRLDANRLFRWLTYPALPVYAGLLVWAMAQFSQGQMNALGMAGWLISTGVIGGILAINTAHELIHKPVRFERFIGGLLLTLVSYGSFKIEHIRGHHRWVATPKDTSTARRDQSVYRFLPRAYRHNPSYAWQLEKARLNKQGYGVWHKNNELLWLWAASAVWLLASALLFGWLGALFFVGQSFFAITALEIINYIEHYGLRREQRADGKYEPVTPRHSWNSSYRLSNWLLFNLQRHSDHHAHAARRYQVLRHFDESPQLPAGYATMFLLALLPPLWRRVMNPRVPM